MGPGKEEEWRERVDSAKNRSLLSWRRRRDSTRPGWK